MNYQRDYKNALTHFTIQNTILYELASVENHCKGFYASTLSGKNQTRLARKGHPELVNSTYKDLLQALNILYYKAEIVNSYSQDSLDVVRSLTRQIKQDALY